MAGELWFACGSAVEERPLWRAMLDGRVTRIVYWPFALPPTVAATADAWLRGHLDALGATYQLSTWTSLDDHRPDQLTRATTDLLFVGGGNTFRLLDHVRRHGFIDAVRDFVGAGGSYHGGSAGAVLACESVEIAVGHNPIDSGMTDLTGLGLLSGATILPHFTADQYDSARQWAQRRAATVVGLPETAGLHVATGGVAVVGTGVVTVFSTAGVVHLPPGERVLLHGVQRRHETAPPPPWLGDLVSASLPVSEQRSQSFAARRQDRDLP